MKMDIFSLQNAFIELCNISRSTSMLCKKQHFRPGYENSIVESVFIFKMIVRIPVRSRIRDNLKPMISFMK